MNYTRCPVNSNDPCCCLYQIFNNKINNQNVELGSKVDAQKRELE